MRLSLRLRVFLIFAGLAAGVLALLAVALLVAGRVLVPEGGTAPPGMTDALADIALIAGLGGLGLVTLVWYLFDANIARPVETLAGALLTGSVPDEKEGRYLADLAPAARAAAQSQARAQARLAEALSAHAEAQSREKSMLEHILSDIGAGAILTDPDGRVLFYNAASAQLLPGLALDRDLRRFLKPGGLDAAQKRLAAGAGATDVALCGVDGTRLSGRLRQMQDEEGGTILILRPARREPVPPRAPVEALRRHAAALIPLLDGLDAPLPDRLQQTIRDEGQGIATALRDLDKALTPSAPRQRRVAAEELARGLGLPLDDIAPVTLAADGWQIGGLIALLGQRLAESGRPPTVSIRKKEAEAVLQLRWQGADLPADLLDLWLNEAPDPDHPELTGADILAAHGSGIWPEPGAAVTLPLSISPVAREARPSVTYDFALASRAAPDQRPLNVLTCVVFDTETTGLSLSDRIVQIAGLRLAGGRLTGETFDTLVNPGRPIPQSSTAIHGITDQMVTDAPDMTTALRGFHHFSEGAVLIAHNAPFDMGLLRAAEAETGQHFPNRVMDTVLLSAMIWGQGAVHSLDAICDRLKVELPAELRHTAMGDAAATAQAYLRMLPALEAKGITRFQDVLAQAQRHRRLLSDANLTAAHGN
ncbi:exonuclease domain-containing protein [Paracoccus aerodenitrificans]|uniref:exonuclease domain-containing protein n=1 Tax=Paracoccus aerodenitrificans TaxID=3017781 RepID=UPI0022F0C3AA|nr:exonuclease domain-containing protein [Paracoccus aerodenitrificans]WBU62681.1 exonuclease domain-containing protein [Paracoccus aerodenitrificans]